MRRVPKNVGVIFMRVEVAADHGYKQVKLGTVRPEPHVPNEGFVMLTSDSESGSMRRMRTVHSKACMNEGG